MTTGLRHRQKKTFRLTLFPVDVRNDDKLEWAFELSTCQVALQHDAFEIKCRVAVQHVLAAAQHHGKRHDARSASCLVAHSDCASSASTS